MKAKQVCIFSLLGEFCTILNPIVSNKSKTCMVQAFLSNGLATAYGSQLSQMSPHLSSSKQLLETTIMQVELSNSQTCELHLMQ